MQGHTHAPNSDVLSRVLLRFLCGLKHKRLVLLIFPVVILPKCVCVCVCLETHTLVYGSALLKKADAYIQMCVSACVLFSVMSTFFN